MTVDLDPQARDLLDQLAAAGVPPASALSPRGARRLREAYPEIFSSDVEPIPVDSVTGLVLTGPGGDLPVRVYDPGGDGPHPVVVYCHGGGWVFGDLDSRDPVCRALATGTDCLVVSVDYRLAPEHTFPAPVRDVYAVTQWVAEHAGAVGGDPDRIALAGDSAGGNLAAAVALLARDRGRPSIDHQSLFYPALDHAFDTDSYEEYAEGYFLSRKTMRWYWEQYLSIDLDGRHPYAAPLQASDLSDLPPALVVTCGFDPLRDEGRAYADRLREAGVPVTHHEYEGAIHGFFSFYDRFDSATDAVERASRDVRSAL